MAFPFTKNAKLIKAIDLNKPEEVKALLRAGAHPRTLSVKHERNAFALALRKDRHAVIQAYAEAVPDILSDHNMVNKIASHAIENSKTATLEALLERGLDIDQKLNGGTSLLDKAAIDGKMRTARWLLQKGASFNSAVDSAKTSILDHIVFQQDKEMMQVLLDQGVPATVKRWPTRSLLGEALKNGKFDIADFLFRNGADIAGEEGPHQSRLIQHAIDKNDLELTSQIIEKGIDINVAQNSLKETPLHYAAREGKFYAVQLLLEKGADVSIRNINGLLAADVAVNPAIRTFFTGTPGSPAQEAAANDGWIMLAPDRVAHVRKDEKISQKVTDVFNFATRERTVTILNLETRHEHSLMRSFDDATDKTPVERAWQELKSLGGTADETLIYATPRKIKPLKDLGTGL